MHALVVFTAQYLIVLSVIIVALVFWRLKSGSKRKSFLIDLILSGLIALLIALIARYFYYDPRPFVAGNFTPYFAHSADNGFVSDHTLLASLLAFVCLFYYKKAGLFLLALAFLIGISRVIAGVHHAADVVSAIIISLLAVLITRFIVKKCSQFKHKQNVVK